MGAELTSEQREAISSELRAGRKIGAIKLYREATGLGLKEAVDAIEHFDYQEGPFSTGSHEFSSASNELSSEQVDDISIALANGSKLEAIKIYRKATGKGLKESKDFIDALIPQLKQQDPVRFARADQAMSTGCGSKVLLIVGLAGLGVWTLRLLA